MQIFKRQLTDYFKFIFVPTQMLALLSLPLFFEDPNLFIYAGIGWLLLGPVGLGIGYHRFLAHQSFRTVPIIENFLVLLGALAGQGRPFEFSLIHRRHHRIADQQTDFQSPVHGLWQSMFRWKVFKQGGYKLSRSDLVRSFEASPTIKWIHQNYYWVYWGFFILLGIFSWKLAIAGMVVPSVIIFFEISAVDFLCHKKWLGYRNFETPDNSTNIWFLSFVTFGLSLHNNHHATPSNYSFSRKWYEIDLGGLIVKMIRFRS